MVCDHCTTSAAIFVPGHEATREPYANVTTTADVLVERGESLRCYCLECAKQAGWPWLVSEETKKRRRAA